MNVVAHNMLAMNASRQYNITSKNKAKSSEKLSSGFRINRSADDAAGLQISEKMRSQVRGLNQASRNIQDGISLCQVADGALNETHAILQRMRELSVQAANDTNADIDRDAISQEINQLTGEIDRIATTTSFNDGIYPLNAIGDNNSVSVTLSAYICINGTNYDVQLSDYVKTGIVTRSGPGTTVIYEDNIYNIGDKVTVHGIVGVVDPNSGCINWPSPDCVWQGGGYGGREGIIYTTEKEQYALSMADLMVDDKGRLIFKNRLPNDGSNFDGHTGEPFGYLHIQRQKSTGKSNLGLGYIAGDDIETSSDNYYVLRAKSTYSKNDENQEIWIQAGALANQGIKLDLVNATCKGIGLKTPVDVSSFDAAGEAMTNIDEAIGAVSNYRSQFGAYQNRLECAKAVDDNTAENTQYAESRIRDTDMAEEMVEYSKNNILEQVGQSVLAQANQSNQGVLSLIS